MGDSGRFMEVVAFGGRLEGGFQFTDMEENHIQKKQ